MKKIIMVVMAMIMSICLLCGCQKIPYNAELYDNAQNLMKSEYLQENITQGAKIDEQYADNTYPKSISCIISTQSEYEKNFSNSSLQVDFSNKMLFVYFFTCNYMGRKYKITKISINKQALTIYIGSIQKKEFSGDATNPEQRCFVVITDKMEVNSVTFIVTD